MIEYIFLFLFFSWLIPFIYIKIKYPFWSYQTIFHTYDIFRFWTKHPYIIRQGVPIKTKFLVPNVKTKVFLDLDEKELEQMVKFIQDHLIESDQIMCLTTKQDVQELFVGYSNPSYISFYYRTEFTYEKERNPMFQETKTCLGLITSRAVKIYLFYGFPHEQYVYYWDHLCSHREYQNKYLGRNLIQNHERHQRIHNDIGSSLFRRDVSLCEGVVPLFQYNIHTFPLEHIKKPPLGHYTVHAIINNNVQWLFDYLYNITHSVEKRPFDICIFPEVNVLDNLIQNKLLSIYVLKLQSKNIGFYFFKNPKICYEMNEERNVLDMVGSILLSVQEPNIDPLFFGGLLNCIHNIQENAETPFKLISFYQLTHNSQLIRRWKWKYNPLCITPSAYYLYNAVFPNMPYHPDKCFVLL